jgi:hypothetical protein
MSYGGHPTRRQMKLYFQGRMGSVDQLWIAEHIGYCGHCYFSLYHREATARSQPPVRRETR